jgi:glycosyltransferase 2 family protein
MEQELELSIETNPPSNGTIRQWIQILFGLLISAGCLYWVLRDIEIRLLLQEIRSVKPLTFAAALLFGVLSIVVRTLRWKALLADNTQIKTKSIFTSMMIGYLANNILPARMGELVRVYVLERRTGISKSAALASIVLERVADVLVLLVLLGVAAAFVNLPSLIVSGSWMAVIGVLVVILVLAFLSGRSAEQHQRLFDSLSQRLPRFGQRLQDAAGCFITGLGTMRSGYRVITTLMLTLLIWGLEVAWTWMVAESLGLTLPWVAPVLVIAVIGISSVLPAAPGSVGTYEFFATLALFSFSVDSTSAVAMAFLLHLSSYLLVSSLGVISLFVENTGEVGFLTRGVLRSVRAS